MLARIGSMSFGGWTLKAAVCSHFGCSAHLCCLLWKAWASAVLWWICPACCHAAAAAAEMWTICWVVSSGGHFHSDLWFSMQIIFCCLICWIMYWELTHSCPLCHLPHHESIINESGTCDRLVWCSWSCQDCYWGPLVWIRTNPGWLVCGLPTTGLNTHRPLSYKIYSPVIQITVALHCAPACCPYSGLWIYCSSASFTTKCRLCCHCQGIGQYLQWKPDSSDRTFDELDLLWQWWSRSVLPGPQTGTNRLRGQK